MDQLLWALLHIVDSDLEVVTEHCRFLEHYTAISAGFELFAVDPNSQNCWLLNFLEH